MAMWKRIAILIFFGLLPRGSAVGVIYIKSQSGLELAKPHSFHFAQVQIAIKKLSFTRTPVLLLCRTFQMLISWAYSRQLLFIPCV